MRIALPLLLGLSLLPFGTASAEDLPIIEHVKSGDFDAARALIEANAELLQARDENLNNSLLHLAAASGDLELIRYLLGKKLDIDDKNWDWQTPLHWAAYGNDPDAIKLLVAAGASIEAETYMGQSPLCIAATYGKLDAAKALLALGASPATLADNDATLLHAAAHQGHTALATLFLDKGLDPNAATFYGKTPLHVAAAEGHAEYVKLLLARGAKVGLLDLRGRSALDRVDEEAAPELAKALAAAGAKRTGTTFPRLTGPYLGMKPPGTEPVLFAPGIVSTEGWEFGITFSPDGKEFLFTRRGGEARLRRNTIMSMRVVDGMWTEPAVVPFSGEYFDYEPYLFDGGKRLIYGSRRPLPSAEAAEGETATSGGDVHQWVLEREGDEWVNARPFGPPLDGEHVMFPTMADDGTLFWNSWDEGVPSDIFFSERGEDGYGAPQRIGPKLDKLGHKYHPYIAPDKSYLIFDAQPNAPESYVNHLYVSHRQEDGSWSAPRQLEFEGAEFDDTGIPCVSPDGKYLFFSASSGIYWVDSSVLRDE